MGFADSAAEATEVGDNDCLLPLTSTSVLPLTVCGKLFDDSPPSNRLRLLGGGPTKIKKKITYSKKVYWVLEVVIIKQ